MDATHFTTPNLTPAERRLYLSAVGQVLRLAGTMPHQTAPWHREETGRTKPQRRSQ